jgi:Flp pilus assembly protein TadG
MLNRRVCQAVIKHALRREKFLGDDEGAAAVEFAFIFPFMLLLYFGLVDITGLISLNRRVVSAAATMADLVTQQKTSVLASTIVDQFNAAYVTMRPLPAANLRIEVFGYRYVGTTITLKWKKSNNQGPLCGADPVTTNMAPMMTNGKDLILARTCTTYTPTIVKWWNGVENINILGASSFTVRQTISSVPRQTNQLTCYATTVAAGTLCS